MQTVYVISNLLVLITFSQFCCTSANDELNYDPADVQELPCFEYKQAENYDAEWFQEKDAKGWRYVVGSKSHLAILLNILTGKTPKETKDLHKSCLRTYTSKRGVSYTGFGNIADYRCKHVKGKKGRECLPTKKSTNFEWASRRSKSEAVIVLTDNKNYAVAFRCSRHNTSVWSIRALKPIISPQDMKAALEFVQKQGFNPDNSVRLVNEDCLEMEDLNPNSQIESVMNMGGIFGGSNKQGKKKSKNNKDSNEDDEEVPDKFTGVLGSLFR